MTSLPIYWGEPGEMGDLLDGSVEPHRVRTLLEQGYQLLPLDTLGTPQGSATAELRQLRRVMVAQPRALTPADNVALDQWVRAGGHVLLVLDPMMTDHSAYPVGDKRRYNDVALIPPVLDRWGLTLTYREGGPLRYVAFGGADVPVSEYGSLSIPDRPADNGCRIEADGVIARCRIGNGAALIVADAAFLNGDAAEDADRAVEAITAAIFE